MRRIDREVKTFAEIVDILERCDTIRLGLQGEKYPYVVPMSFGYEVREKEIILFVHGAPEGLKNERMNQCGDICVEADLCHGFTETAHGITTLYESIIGFGSIERMMEKTEARKGLDLICAHSGYRDYVYDDRALAAAAVYRIVLETVTGKRNKG